MTTAGNVTGKITSLKYIFNNKEAVWNFFYEKMVF